MGYIQQTGASKLSKVIQDDVKELHVFVADSTPLYARAYAAPIMTLLGLLILDWRLAAVTVGLLISGLLFLALQGRIMVIFQSAIWKLENKLVLPLLNMYRRCQWYEHLIREAAHLVVITKRWKLTEKSS